MTVVLAGVVGASFGPPGLDLGEASGSIVSVRWFFPRAALTSRILTTCCSQSVGGPVNPLSMSKYA